MGTFAQRRIIRKIDLEQFLRQINSVPFPKVNLEQYLITETVAANMLHIAGYCNNDIVDRNVLDLGCGTGRLSLGASFIGANSVLGIDLDKEAVATAIENSRRTGLSSRIQWITGDIQSICGRFDTVLENPPFGVQRMNADRKFLEKALEVGRAIYSLHNHPKNDIPLLKELKNAPSRMLQVTPSPFLEEFIENRGGSIQSVYAMPLSIPRIFSFHTKEKHEIVVDLYIIRKETRGKWASPTSGV